MEMKEKMSVVDKYFGHTCKFSNFLLKGTLVVVVGQQIYYPQSLKYYHLAILFTYIILLEFFRDDRRAFHEEYALIASVLGCSVITVAEYAFNQSFSIGYLSILLISIYLTAHLAMRIYKLVKSKSFDQFTVENQKMLNKSTAFIRVLTIFIMAVLAFSVMYCIFELFKLF